jgi:hypothetical protein
MTLKERCTNAHAFLVTKRKELEGLIIEYRGLNIQNRNN